MSGSYEETMGNIFITPPEDSVEDFLKKILNEIGIETPNPKNEYWPYWFVSYPEFLEAVLILIREGKLSNERLKVLLTKEPGEDE